MGTGRARLAARAGAERHRGLWFNFGHEHLGLTMSAKCGEKLRALYGEPSNVDLYCPSRFGRHKLRLSLHPGDAGLLSILPSGRPPCARTTKAHRAVTDDGDRR
jgi:hypothetical protein